MGIDWNKAQMDHGCQITASDCLEFIQDVVHFDLRPFLSFRV